MLAHIRTPRHRPQMATVRSNVFQPPARDESRRGEAVVCREVVIPEPSIKLVESKRIEKDEVAIEKAHVLISGGKGVGSREEFRLVEELATELTLVDRTTVKLDTVFFYTVKNWKSL